jgi:uncharacterized membrane protein YGL010W
LLKPFERREAMSPLEWSAFAAAVVVVGILVGFVMHVMERKKPKYLD